MTTHKRRTRSVIAVLLAVLALTIAAAVSAHPLGNFTISRYSAVALAAESAEVHYIIDMAKIPTYQERQAMDSDADGAISANEEAAYLDVYKRQTDPNPSQTRLPTLF